jgi:O-methyltransferase involved in polyketide biosynthesis
MHAGYLERAAGDGLLTLLAANSAPNSRIIMTVPPSPAERDKRSAEAAEAAATAAAKAAEGQQAGVQQGPDDVYQYPDGTRVYRPKLHHATFEEPEETLTR